MASDADQIVDLYRRHARAWANDRGTALTEKSWLDRFLALIPGEPDILDLGCGSADPIARYFIENGCQLTGVDSSPELIAICKEKFPENDWRIADMRTLSLGRRFHGILAWDSFFHLCHEDQRRMFPIFREHAARGAALMFTSGQVYGEAIGTYRGEPLYHASLDTSEYRELLAKNGFEVVRHTIEDPSNGGRTVWLSRLTGSVSH